MAPQPDRPGQSDADEPHPTTAADWSYETAFVRNRGIISAEEQARLRTSRVAICGMGGVGGLGAGFQAGELEREENS